MTRKNRQNRKTRQNRQTRNAWHTARPERDSA